MTPSECERGQSWDRNIPAGPNGLSIDGTDACVTLRRGARVGRDRERGGEGGEDGSKVPI